MKNLNSRERFILIITLGLTVSFIAYQFVIRPIHEGSMDINDRLLLAHDQLIKARQLVAQKPLVEARYQYLKDLIGGVDSEEAQIPVIVSKIEGAARQSNIHIANIQPQKPVVEKEAEFLEVELEIDGQWLDIVQFFYLLQQRPNLYFIDEINLEKYSDAENTLRGRMVISRMCLVDPLTVI